jgi:hypothetical protein
MSVEVVKNIKTQLRWNVCQRGFDDLEIALCRREARFPGKRSEVFYCILACLLSQTGIYENSLVGFPQNFRCPPRTSISYTIDALVEKSVSIMHDSVLLNIFSYLIGRSSIPVDRIAAEAKRIMRPLEVQKALSQRFK